MCAIDRFVDLSEIRTHLRPFYSELGRPSIDPEPMIQMLLADYCFGIRSDRRLCDEKHLDLEVAGPFPADFSHVIPIAPLAPSLQLASTQ